MLRIAQFWRRLPAAFGRCFIAMINMRPDGLNEERFVARYAQLADSTESFARCVYMFLEVAANRQNETQQSSTPEISYEHPQFGTDDLD